MEKENMNKILYIKINVANETRKASGIHGMLLSVKENSIFEVTVTWYSWNQDTGKIFKRII